MGLPVSWLSWDKQPVTGTEYANLIAAYLVKNYGSRGLVVYREVSLGKSIIGKNRRIDILAVHRESNRACAIECKCQSVAGTADEKIPYALADLAAMHIPAFVAYAGEGFSRGVLHLLEASRLAAYCLPEFELTPGEATLELDHLMATTFGFWDAVLRKKAPFDLAAFENARAASKASSRSVEVSVAPSSSVVLELSGSEEGEFLAVPLPFDKPA